MFWKSSALTSINQIGNSRDISLLKRPDGIILPPSFGRFDDMLEFWTPIQAKAYATSDPQMNPKQS